ncbi:hypothetical protein [Halochromatium sp.]
MSSEPVNTGTTRRRWETLCPDEQTALLEAYNRWLDQWPPTCSLAAKTARFRAWLETQGIDFDPDR